ncbi:hypothetical protein MLD38_024995 [Melastoma candidum]|uniref:Uncharacterized protein n=1 Tax=Melastoma candidum TaxID=119954 RepID=A0ACB9NWW0_9MYRT|nr:hypothetical protein MLD38_024995 [Melastoma candidum]
MALFRRFFYRKPPDRLLEISSAFTVLFDCCFSTGILEEDDYKVYMGGIVAQLQDYFPDASFMVFNFREGEKRSQISDILSNYDMTVMDYPRQYEGCPLLPLEMIHHFLKSSESWLSLEGQQNVLLMHCGGEDGPCLRLCLLKLKLLFSNSNKKKHVRHYLQEECMLLKVDIQCRVQGDVVLECIHLDEDLVREENF